MADRLFFFLFLSFPAVSAVLITPSLPQIASEYGLTLGTVQWMMSLFLAGYAAGQLIYGPAVERFGKKRSVFLGLALALIGSAISFFASSFEVLCFGRLVQGLGAAAGMKLTFSSVKELTGSKTSSFFLSFAIMPALAVFAGGILTVGWGWKSGFLFLAAFTVFLAFLAARLPIRKETEKVQYAQHFRDSFLLWHGLLVGLGASAIYLFATFAPFTGINGMGLPADAYGLWFIIPSLGLIVGLRVGAKLKTAPRITMLTGILLVLIGSLMMSVCFANLWIYPALLFWPMFVVQIGTGIVCSTAFAKGISESADKAGATAVLQFVNISTAFAAVILAGIFSSGGMLLPMSLFLVSAAMVIVWLELRDHHQKA